MQLILNILIYLGLIGWFALNAINRDWWYCFVIGFVVLVSLVVSVLPGYHASKVSPGEYPYED